MSKRNYYTNALRGIHSAIMGAMGTLYNGKNPTQQIVMVNFVFRQPDLPQSEVESFFACASYGVRRWQYLRDSACTKTFENAMRGVVNALRAKHAERYEHWRVQFPADWKVNYAHGASEQAWLRYACKMYHNWLQREADRRNLQGWRDWADRTPEATKVAAQKWREVCDMYDRAAKSGSNAELVAYYNVKK